MMSLNFKQVSLKIPLFGNIRRSQGQITKLKFCVSRGLQQISSFSDGDLIVSELVEK